VVSATLIDVTRQMTAGDLLVGVGTLALAGLTYLSVRVARRSLEAADAPLVIGSHVPKDSQGLEDIIKQPAAAALFKLPFAGLLPPEIELKDRPGRLFVMRLWNVGRGPAVLKDVRLTLGKDDVLGTTLSDVVVTAGGVSDQSWAKVDLPATDGALIGSLRIIYEHPDGRLLHTEQEVELEDSRLYFRTIKRKRARRRAVRHR
jgi:hypothetical protein